MAWYGQLLVITPHSAAMCVLAAANDVPIQITALAILAISVIALWKYLNRITEEHKDERTKLFETLQTNQAKITDLYQQNLKLLLQVVQTLQDRPCIMHDQRIIKLADQLEAYSHADHEQSSQPKL